jgi:hypothetical protein
MQDSGTMFLLQNYSTSLSVFNFPELYPKRMVINSLRILLQLSKFKRFQDFGRNYKLPEKNSIYILAERMHGQLLVKPEKTPDDIVDIHEIQDIMFTFFPGRGGVHQDQKQETAGAAKSKLPETIFQDKQNIHDSEINQKNIRIATKLIEKFPAEYDMKYDYGIHSEFIEKYKNNAAVFGSRRKFRLIDVLLSLISYANSHEFREEINRILFEQLYEGELYCSTGKLGRMISSIQGFTDDEELILLIGDEKFMKTHLLNFINLKIQQSNNESVVDGLLDKNDIYKKFIYDNAKKWKKETGSRFNITNERIMEIIKEKYM